MRSTNLPRRSLSGKRRLVPQQAPPLRSSSKRKRPTDYFVRTTFQAIAALALLPVLYVNIHFLGQHSDPAPHTEHKDAKVAEYYRQKAQAQGRAGGKSTTVHPAHHNVAMHQPASDAHPRVLTAFLELPSTVRKVPSEQLSTADKLVPREFPRVQGCPTDTILMDLPVDDYPTEDPFLPWIHDYFVSPDAQFVRFVAQNRRRCDTGEDHADTMEYWEPQVALLQPIPMVENTTASSEQRWRLATSWEEATHPSTRFQCRFEHASTGEVDTTLSVFPFDYEYVTWRKQKGTMMDRKGSKDSTMFWLSTMLFACPIPEKWQAELQTGSSYPKSSPTFYLDLIPIRIPVRTEPLFSEDLVGPTAYASGHHDQLQKTFGNDHFLPNAKDTGRWANLPVCPRANNEQLPLESSANAANKVAPAPRKPHRMVACTWTAASYTRRGDVVRVSDSAKRFREWVHFHLLVGFDHVYVYDNTDPDTNNTDLWKVSKEFPASQVTYHRWPYKICNNNRPAHKNPGERSSQYAAEASCRERYGPLTDWMTFLDTDEYLVPMKADQHGKYTWGTVLDDMEAKNQTVLQFLSSRGKPRIDLMEAVEDQSGCVDPALVKGANANKTEPCVSPRPDETFLKVYNCDYIRPPKPTRFQRARKQLYRPSHVLSHFVHYSTVTADLAETYSSFQQQHPGQTYKAVFHNGREVFVNELTEGALIHARSVLLHETRRRSAECYLTSKFNCMVGHQCEDSVSFADEKHKLNIFQNSDGSYCNCWANPVVDQVLVPLLEDRLRKHNSVNAIQ